MPYVVSIDFCQYKVEVEVDVFVLKIEVNQPKTPNKHTNCIRIVHFIWKDMFYNYG